VLLTTGAIEGLAQRRCLAVLERSAEAKKSQPEPFIKDNQPKLA